MHICRKIIGMFLCIVFAVAVSGCTREIKYSELTGENTPKFDFEGGTVESSLSNSEEKKEELLSKVNNEKSADKLIKTIYPHEFLQELIPYQITMLFAQMPPECIRLGKDPEFMYFVYKSNEGYYAVCKANLEVEPLGIAMRVYYDSPRYLEDFEKLKMKGATLTEVMEFDPYGWYVMLFTSAMSVDYSVHEVFDGCMIRVYYEYNGEKNALVVSGIEMESGKEDTVFYNLPQTDQEMILESLGGITWGSPRK